MIFFPIGPLHDRSHGKKSDFQNNATRSSPPRPAFVLEVPLRNLLTGLCDFVPCHRIVQRAYWESMLFTQIQMRVMYF